LLLILSPAHPVPKVAALVCLPPSVVRRVRLAERAEEWGEGSPLFIARVRGDFPAEDEGVLLRLSDLEAAVKRELDTEDKDVVFGVDPARFGADASALAVWRGNELLSVETQRQLDTMQVAAWIASAINRLKPKCVTVDEIGIGAGVLDRLRQLRHGIVTGLNVGSRASRPDLYANKRAEVFWQSREALEKGDVKLPDHEQLLAELSALRFEYSQSGQIKLEAKENTRKRVGRSPDLADATVLGFAYKAPGPVMIARAFGPGDPGWLSETDAPDDGRWQTYEGGNFGDWMRGG